MAKEELASLDIKFLVKELRKTLAGGLFKKVYQFKRGESYEFIFEIYVPGKETLWLHADSKKLFLTNTKRAESTEPPMFCMFLRKHLSGERIRGVSQHNFDRVVEIETPNCFVIFEIFSGGNVIITDSFHKILMPMENQKWKDRVIKPGVGYKYPISAVDPFKTDLDSMKSILRKFPEKKIVSVVSATFGFGKDYGNETCFLAGIDPEKEVQRLSLEEVTNLGKIIKSLENAEIKPTVYNDSVYIFPLKTAKEKQLKQTMTLSEALDDYFSKKDMLSMKEAGEKQAEQHRQKLERIHAEQKAAQERLQNKAIEAKTVADLIYQNYQLIESVLSAVKSMKKEGKGWDEIKNKMKDEKSVVEIKENEGIVVLNLENQKVEMDFNKTIEKNAAEYYEESKKTKAKLSGLATAMESGVIDKKIEAQKGPSPITAIKCRKKWYEKFKWFYSSAELLVIAGRDAIQNESIVKKHAEKDDFLFHADIHGAAFVLIKSDQSSKQAEGLLPIKGSKQTELDADKSASNKGLLPQKQIDPITMKEAAEFAAANSKAWTRSVGSVDVSAFRPEQATKPDGSLGKGSFVIQGQRIWFKDQSLKISVGVKIDKEKEVACVVSGPVMATKKHSDYFLTVEPGLKDSLDLSREIKNKLLLKSRPEHRFYIEKIPLEDIQRTLPSGTGNIVE